MNSSTWKKKWKVVTLHGKHIDELERVLNEFSKRGYEIFSIHQTGLPSRMDKISAKGPGPDWKTTYTVTAYIQEKVKTPRKIKTVKLEPPPHKEPMVRGN